MSEFGVQPEGFKAPRTADFLQIIREDYSARLEVAGSPLPADYDFERDLLVGLLTAVMASRLGEEADMTQALADQRDRANAVGLALDHLGIIVGVPRKGQTASQVALVLTGVAGTIIIEGKQVEGGGIAGDQRWKTSADVTIVDVILTTGDLVFTDLVTVPDTILRSTGSWIADGIGPGTKLVINGSASNNKTVEVASATPTLVTLIPTDTLVTEGPVAATATAGLAGVVGVATEEGAITADSTDISTIVNPVTGWETVSNPVAAAIGLDREADPVYRARQAESLAISGAGSIPAIRARVAALEFVTAATVIDNDTEATTIVEGKTLRTKSILVVVNPSTLTDAQKAEVIDAIYATATGGIRVEGTDVTSTVTGADGFDKFVAFDFATELTVNVVSTLVLDSGFILVDVEDAVKAAIVTYFGTLNVGDAVRLLDINAAVAKVDGVAGASFTLNGGSVDILTTAIEVAILGTNTVTL